jgi:xylulokinase
MRGAWVGLSPRHDRTALLRAALEGVALAIRDALTALRDAGTAARDLRLAGGGSTEAAWRQPLSDVLGSTLRPVDVAAASGRGAALLGARAAWLLDEPSLRGLLPPAGDPAAVRRADHAAYDAERHAMFQQRVNALRSQEASR